MRGLARGRRSGESCAAMRPFLFLLPLPLAACALPDQEYGHVTAMRYEAFGDPPLWRLSIGDDRLALTLHDPALGPTSTSFSGVEARTAGETTRWRAGGDGLGGVSVEARRETCIAADGTRYEDEVTVSLSGRQLEGCGGRKLPGRQG